MELFIQNILKGVRKWVNDKLDDITFVVSSHINELTNRMTAVEREIEDIVAEGGEPNVIEAITVNGTQVTVTNKTAAITITETSVAQNDKVLSLSGGVISSQISLSYDQANSKIKLLGKGESGSEELISEISTTDFIKDGMLTYAGLHVRTTSGEPAVTTWDPVLPTLPSGTTEPSVDGTYIVLVWNTDANKTVTFINVSSLIDIYTAGTGLTLTGNTFSLNAATSSTVGGVYVEANSGLTLANDGKLSITPPTVAQVLAVLNAEEDYDDEDDSESSSSSGSNN